MGDYQLVTLPPFYVPPAVSPHSSLVLVVHEILLVMAYPRSGFGLSRRAGIRRVFGGTPRVHLGSWKTDVEKNISPRHPEPEVYGTGSCSKSIAPITAVDEAGLVYGCN